MTTPYIDEAERCNRVAFMHNGEIISLDTPGNIKHALNKEVIEIVCTKIRDAYRIIKNESEFEIQMFGDRINIIMSNIEKEYPVIENLLKKNSIEILNYRQITPSLENIFIHLIRGDRNQRSEIRSQKSESKED
jgi:ABC-2 type transport system ATP-binding protein